jgi:HK97 family phage portal protein
LFNVPPPLIGHADKASSWASSLEQLNLMLLMYSLQPDLIRQEQRIKKILFSAEERAKGLEAKFSVAGLLRADAKTRRQVYDSALRNGDMSINEVRDLEDRPGIGPEGDAHRVQMQMVDVNEIPEQNNVAGTGDKK